MPGENENDAFPSEGDVASDTVDAGPIDVSEPELDEPATDTSDAGTEAPDPLDFDDPLEEELPSGEALLKQIAEITGSKPKAEEDDSGAEEEPEKDDEEGAITPEADTAPDATDAVRAGLIEDAVGYGVERGYVESLDKDGLQSLVNAQSRQVAREYRTIQDIQAAGTRNADGAGDQSPPVKVEEYEPLGATEDGTDFEPAIHKMHKENWELNQRLKAAEQREQSRATQATSNATNAVQTQIDGYIANLGADYEDVYGSGARSLLDPESVAAANRNELIATATDVSRSMDRRGIKPEFEAVMAKANAIVFPDRQTTALRQELTKKVKKRGQSLSARATGSKPNTKAATSERAAIKVIGAKMAEMGYEDDDVLEDSVAFLD